MWGTDKSTSTEQEEAAQLVGKEHAIRAMRLKAAKQAADKKAKKADPKPMKKKKA